IVPLAILAARVTTHALTLKTSRHVQAAVAAVLLITFGAGLPGTFAARADPEWLRPARERHAGIEATAAYLNTLPAGTIVYDHWAGWLLGWYTVQARPPAMWLRTVYYPTPEQLVTGALAQPDPLPRYFVVPHWAPVHPWIAALDEAGFSPRQVMTSGQFSLYELLPP
ncbi:MAG: hypothetical protein JXN59_10345, partial [Anaerolineae bacterium]|nr:hypothetical protein [Anaerolineae bacterium]